MNTENLEEKNLALSFSSFMSLARKFPFCSHGKDFSREFLKQIEGQARSLTEELLYSVEVLGKFLAVGVNDKDVGIIKEGEIIAMANHIGFLGQMGGCIFDIQEHARMLLAVKVIL